MLAPTPRYLDLDTLVLAPGQHAPDGVMCVMEAVAYVAGEPWSDHPVCASPVIAAFCRRMNDSIEPYGSRIRAELKRRIPRLVGSRGALDVELHRAHLAVDWALCVCAPIWLDAAGLGNQAAMLRALPADADATAAAVADAADAAAAAYATATDATDAADAAAAAAYAAAVARAGTDPMALIIPGAVDLIDRMLALT